MAFVAEDGTGVTNANAYISVSFFRTYHTDRGRVVDAATYPDSEVESAIIQGTDFVEKRYSGRWVGSGRLLSTQGLSNPRKNVYIDGVLVEGVPRLLQEAVAEYALRALAAALMPDPPSAFTEGAVVKEKVVLGPITEETEYADPAGAISGTEIVNGKVVPSYPEADLLLRPLLTGGGGSVIRA